jgi:hypothetical protein
LVILRSGEERGLRVLENRVPRDILGPKRNEVIGKWRKVNYDEHQDFLSLWNVQRVSKLRRMKWAGHVERMDKNINVYRVLMGKYEEND